MNVTYETISIASGFQKGAMEQWQQHVKGKFTNQFSNDETHPAVKGTFSFFWCSQQRDGIEGFDNVENPRIEYLY